MTQALAAVIGMAVSGRIRQAETRSRADDRSRERAGSPRAVLVAMCVGYFLVLLDVTIVNVGLPLIGAGLHAGVSGLRWMVDGYALALASLMLAGRTAGDLHGHKRVVLSGLVVLASGLWRVGWLRARPC
jgi:MFS transporter, DHA2 family, methylenomycin A resistance protein